MQIRQARRLWEGRQGCRFFCTHLQAGQWHNWQIFLEKCHPLSPQRAVDLFFVRQLLLLQVGKGHLHNELQDALHLLTQLLPSFRMTKTLYCTIADTFPFLLLSKGLDHFVSQILVPLQSLLFVRFLFGNVLLLPRLSIPHEDLLKGFGPPTTVADGAFLNGFAVQLFHQDLLQLVLFEHFLLALLLHQHPSSPTLAFPPCNGARLLGLLDLPHEEACFVVQLLVGG
mmetsp:Transcript_53698/g.117418  ORF Transcript_53698/g.117418 Transcript_53698/m.117418 type:complete len:227 (+) Transcript_53698:830-1510(+)